MSQNEILWGLDVLFHSNGCILEKVIFKQHKIIFIQKIKVLRFITSIDTIIFDVVV